ncbi:rab15 effector protein-like [Oncorhynchus kisutch]|uniref:rab15 effector protein-like n=1 Tax=Oncorhynchus kisutch TaxID=8019 RepID=UPI0009A04AAC|nr:rab15 effector protein-like [Oncorhynchus kisutch]
MQELAEEILRQRDIKSEVLSQASLYVAGQLRNSLDFQDPQNQLQPSLGTPNDIFLVQFIFSCIERGLYNCIVTSKMTLTAEPVAGDQARPMLSEARLKAERLGRSIRERVATNALFWNMSHLEEFCGLVERDCLGMLLVFSLLWRPMDIRRVMLRSLTTWATQRLPLDGERLLRDFFQNTTSSLSVTEMLELCMDKRDVGNVYIRFMQELSDSAFFD